ncbi:MAG: DUF2490 domain-containing protein [Bacteroidota bacterium]
MPIILSTSRFHIAVLLFFLSATILAQSTVEVGLLPTVNLNIGLQKNWEINTKWETRQLIQRRIEGENDGQGFTFLQSDQSAVLARKVGLNSKVVAGYLLRIKDGEFIHRMIQQFSIVQRLPQLRLAHRFATDQTFVPDEKLETRLRYRIGTEIALNGQSADAGEPYLKINHEYLGSWQGPDFDLEIRVVPVLGYKFNDINKLELGLDFRFDSFLEEAERRRYWGLLAWYYKLGKV